MSGSGPVFHAGLDGHTIIAAPQATHGGAINIHNYGAGPSAPVAGPRVTPGAFSTVPFLPDPDFVERPAIAEWLRGRLHRLPRRAALVGLGGIGKSQIAIRYAQDVRTLSPAAYVFWVHAGTTQRFEEAYRTIAERLGLLERYGAEADVLRLVRNWLCDETNGRWLMVVDNADDALVFYAKVDNRDPLAAFIPQTENGSILVTSRSRTVAERLTGSGQNVLAVPSMDETRAVRLLCHKLGEECDASGATEMVRELECLPLAITQAAAYIVRQSPRMSLSTYLTNFRRDEKKKARLLGLDMGDIRRDPSAFNSISATWQMTFESIERERPTAANLLAFMSFFSPQGIPNWILRDQRGDTSRADDEFEEDLNVLKEYSLVTATVDEGMLEMHQIVQVCMQEWLSSTAKAAATKGAFIQAMARNYPKGTFKNWTTCRVLDVHIRLFEDGEPDDDNQAKDIALVLANAARYRQALGSFDVAERLLRKVIRLRERAIGLENSKTFASIHNLGLILIHQCKYAEAERMLQQVFEGFKELLGWQHPDTLRCAANLGSVWSTQGRYEEGERLLRWALECRITVLGPEHVDTLTSVNCLGSTLFDQDRCEEAEGMGRWAFESNKKVQGLQHPDTLMCASNLGRYLLSQGKYHEAEEMYCLAVEGQERTLGLEHQVTTRSVFRLAQLFRQQKRFEESKRLFDRAWEGFHSILGPLHPETIECGQMFSTLQQEMRQKP